MRKTFPEWQTTLLWFVASIGATGAFWYLIAEKKVKSAAAIALVTILLVVLAVLLSIRNERLKHERLERYGVSGLKQRLLSLSQNIDRFVVERKALAVEIEKRGPEDQEMYRFNLQTERLFNNLFWQDVVLLRDRIAKEFAVGDRRLNEHPRGTHDMSEVAQALSTVAAKLR